MDEIKQVEKPPRQTRGQLHFFLFPHNTAALGRRPLLICILEFQELYQTHPISQSYLSQMSKSQTPPHSLSLTHSDV